MKIAYKVLKRCNFTLLSEAQSENKCSAAVVLSFLKISKDSIKKSNGLYLFENLFCLHWSRK